MNTLDKSDVRATLQATIDGLPAKKMWLEAICRQEREFSDVGI